MSPRPSCTWTEASQPIFTMPDSGKRAIQTSDAPAAAGAYSQGIRVGDLVFVAGQGPADPATGEVRGSTIAEQTRATLRNVEAILRAAGAHLSDVVKATVHLADLDDFAGFDAAYRDVMPAPFPVRTTVGSQLANILVEIDVIAISHNPSPAD